MNAPRPGSESAPDFDREAAEWLVKRDRGLTAAEQDEFLQWLAADPRHGEWFARHQETWSEFDLLAEWRPEHSTEPNPDLLARPRARSRSRVVRWAAPAALAVAAGVAIMFTLRSPNPNPPEPATPAAAGVPAVAQAYERRVLADGSVAELNRGAAIEVQFTAGERRVALLRGEAHFTVEKDAARPFIVRARGVDVRAVGTAFNVRLEDAEVEVLVTHGRVELAQSAGPALAAAPSRDEQPNRHGALASSGPANQISELAAGHRAVVSLAAPAPPQIVKVSPAQIAEALAWQPVQLLDFSSVRLDRVLAEFNRRNPMQVTLADAELGEIIVVASIRSDNVEGLVRFLETTASVASEPRGAGEIVLRRKR